jgi:hypothetical protein
MQNDKRKVHCTCLSPLKTHSPLCSYCTTVYGKLFLKLLPTHIWSMQWGLITPYLLHVNIFKISVNFITLQPKLHCCNVSFSVLYQWIMFENPRSTNLLHLFPLHLNIKLHPPRPLQSDIHVGLEPVTVHESYVLFGVCAIEAFGPCLRALSSTTSC